MEMKQTTKNKVLFFKGNALFETEETELNIGEGFVQFVLAKEYEKQPTDERLWAIVKLEGEYYEYELNYERKLLIEIH
jgi:hypothetical protein